MQCLIPADSKSHSDEWPSALPQTTHSATPQLSGIDKWWGVPSRLQRPRLPHFNLQNLTSTTLQRRRHSGFPVLNCERHKSRMPTIRQSEIRSIYGRF